MLLWGQIAFSCSLKHLILLIWASFSNWNSGQQNQLLLEIVHVLLADTIQLNPSLQKGSPAWLTLILSIPTVGSLHRSQPASKTLSCVGWQSALKCSWCGCCADSLNSHILLLIYISSLSWDLSPCSQILPELSLLVAPSSPTELMCGTLPFWCIIP